MLPTQAFTEMSLRPSLFGASTAVGTARHIEKRARRMERETCAHSAQELCDLGRWRCAQRQAHAALPAAPVAAWMMRNGTDLWEVAGLPAHDARNVAARLWASPPGFSPRRGGGDVEVAEPTRPESG